MHSDVLIVGYGPVGQVLAILLAQKGWDVTVVERWPQPYTMPRAVSYDGEAARIVATTGVGDSIGDIVEPSRDYTWTNAQGQKLLHIDVADDGRMGWPDSTSMYQPGLEEAFAERGTQLPNLHVFRGHEAVELVDHGDGVTLRTANSRTFTARWVVGCDGANSFVRDHVATAVTDFGFSNDWLICDVVVSDGREFRPNNLQICDPARPTTVVSAGPGHRRWEFMRVPGETIDEINNVETAWRLLEPFDVNPGNAILQRQGFYTFQARFANKWRSDRVLLAGDAVHLMPPFAGQGMCSGFRDAANLSWKLDLVLQGLADDKLLDTYTAERRAHVQHAIGMSVNLGRVICQADHQAAADRDAVMLGAQERGTAHRQTPLQSLNNGFLRRNAKKAPIRPAGNLTPQGRVACGSHVGLFDDVVGLGFTLLSTVDPRSVLDDDQLEFLVRLGTQLVHLAPSGTQASLDRVVDVDDVYLPYLAETGSMALLVRPDFYVFGGATDSAELSAVVNDLQAQMVGELVASR